MSPRLLLIETRRNVGPWFVPVILLISWWLLSAWGWIAFLWWSTNSQLQASVVAFAAPAMAGAAAWMAGRERRRGTEDLLASTPKPPLPRGITLWAATALWGIVAYAIFAAYMMGRTALSATVGGPALWPVVIVVTAILAASAWGFLFGSLIPSRFTAPVVAVATLGVQQFFSGYMAPIGDGGYATTWVSFLAPDKTAGEAAPWQALIYVGLTGMALAALAVKCRKDLASWSALAASAVLVAAGVVMVRGELSPGDDPVTRPIEASVGYVEPALVCAGSPVTVCTLPEFQPVLDEAVVAANRLAEPLLGLPGVPLRAEDEDAPFIGGGSTSMLEVGGPAWLDVGRFADKLVADPGSTRNGEIVNEAQLALRSWLVQRAGIDSHPRCDDPRWQFSGPPGYPTPEVCAAAARFARLSPAEQRAWLEEHYAALRRGELTLADLP